MHWLSSDYIMKPAVQKEVKLPDRLIHEDIIYAGPLDIEYSREFINIYRKVNSSPDLRDGTASIADYGVFSNTFLFLIRNENEGELLVYSQDGQLVRNVESIDGIFHSGSVLAVVNADARTITVLDRELKTLFTITYPPSLSVEKIVFSHELLAVLYEKSAGSSEHFSMIYRLDSGSRVGKVNSADIAPRLKKTGFIAVETRDDGLYVTALDQNSNKQSYLFKGGGFQKALIRQCGGDRYFVKALQIENDAVKSEFVMVHDFFRYRRLAAATREGSDPGDDHGNIIAVIGDYFLTDADYLLDRNLKSVYSIAPPHSVPFRLLPSGDTGTSLSAEGSVAGIDFTPLLSGLGKDARKNLLLADVKGTLFVKEIFSFLGHFVVVTPRLILIYNGDLELEKKIELPGNGHIDIVRILNESVFFTFDSSEDISIYSIDGNFSETRIAVINAPQGKIWDISDKWIIYGHDPESAPAGTGRPGRASILIAKGIGSNRMYERVLSLPLHDAPSLVKNSLILPFEDLTELIELSSGKRTVFDGNLYRGGSLPFGFTNTGYVVDLPALEAFPYRFDPERVHAPVSSIGQWIDMGEYLLNVGSGQVYEIIRSGVTTLGENSVCSVSGLRNKKVLNCLDLDTKSITVTLSLDGTYESAYSDPDLIFVHDSHSLVTIRNNTEGN